MAQDNSHLNPLIYNSFKMTQPSLYELIPLCEQLLQTNNPTVHQTVAPMLTSVHNIPAILTLLPQSDALMFAFTSILSKAVENGSFVYSGQTRSEEEGVGQAQQQQRIRVYLGIVQGMFDIVLRSGDKPAYLIKMSLNLISVCIRSALEGYTNAEYLHAFLAVLLPTFQPNRTFISNHHSEIFLLVPSSTIDSTTYPYALAILKGLLEFVTTSAYFRSYYEYRRNIYTFRNAYLGGILNVAVQYCKLLGEMWESAQNNHLNTNNQLNGSGNHNLQQIGLYLNQTLLLLEAAIMYPFTLNLHQYDNEEELAEGASISSETYFPNYFRHVLCDRPFLSLLLKYYLWFINSNAQINPIRNEIYGLVRVMGRMASASSYVFNSDDQRIEWRSCMQQIVNTLSIHYKFMDSYYLQSLSDIFVRSIGHLLQAENTVKIALLKNILGFSLSLVACSEIKLEDGKRNPFSRGFELAGLISDEAKGQQYEQQLTNGCQVIMDTAMRRLLDPRESEKIMRSINQSGGMEVQCFQQLFEYIPVVFQLNLGGNLKFLSSLDLSLLSDDSKVCWLHLCSILLPSHHATLHHTSIILKYFDLAIPSCSLAALKYIHTLVSSLLGQITDGCASTQLWYCVEEIRQENFQSFVLGIVKRLISNFRAKDEQIIDYSLEIFKSIYSKLKKHDHPKFQPFYSLIHSLLQELSNTSLALASFSPKRIAFFSIISTIWLSRFEYSYLYDIYSVVSHDFHLRADLSILMTYMHDVTGLMEPIEWHQTFQVMAQLAITDLKIILPRFLGKQNKMKELFGEYKFVKSFCKMIEQFVSDTSKRVSYETQCDLGLDICELFYPYIKELVSPQYSGIELPRSIIGILCKIPQLNPLIPLIPLSPHLKQLQSSDFPSLLTEYFGNLSRLEDLLSIYPFIESSIDHLVEFWEEAINRDLHVQGVELKTVVQSRLWSNRRQKENLAKLVWMIGKWDPSYWDLKQFSSQRQFIDFFMSKYV